MVGASVLLLFTVVAIVVRAEHPIEEPASRAALEPERQEAAGSATIESEQVVELGFTSGGRISEILVREGDRVKAGDVLAKLEVDELELERRASLAARAKANAGVALAVAGLEHADSQLELARSTFQRAEALHQSGAYSTAKLDEARGQRDQSEVNRRALTAGLAQARAEVSSARESAELISYRIAQGTLIAPVDGIITRRLREPGGVTSPGQTVLELASIGRILASTWIDETALGSLRIGAQAHVVLRSAPDHLIPGRVTRIAPQADRETHEFLVDVELLEVPEPLVFGQRADVFISLSSPHDVQP